MKDPHAATRAFETRAIHAGADANPTSALTPPIVQSSTFKLDSALHGAQLAQGLAPTEFYTRWGNPTTSGFESVVASLEGAEAAIATASGMAALSLLLFSHLEQGDHLIVGQAIYSGVSELAGNVLPRHGVDATMVDATQLDDVKRAIRPNTKLILVETPTNPILELCDLKRLAEIAREAGVTTAVDNTFATPLQQRPIELGIDVVVHAATKYLGGHSDATGGVLCATKEKVEKAWYLLKLFGCCLSPFEAWLFQRGLKTLSVRVAEQARSALSLATFLEAHSAVKRVFYPGLPSHPQYELACAQMSGFGGMLSFEVEGGYNAAVRLAESLQIIQLAVSLGGVESIIQHPASMTHGMLPASEREKAGIAPGILRLSVGLESVDDLRMDLSEGLTKV